MLHRVFCEHLFGRGVQTEMFMDDIKLNRNVMQVLVHLPAFLIVEMEGRRLITLVCHDKISNVFLEQWYAHKLFSNSKNLFCSRNNILNNLFLQKKLMQHNSL